MNKITAIALNTFKEAIRDRILFALFFFGIGMLAISLVMSSITAGNPLKVVTDMGIASINLFGVLIAIFIGIGLVYKEMEKKTIYTILSKPISRWQFIIGKYTGLIITLAVEIFFMTIFLVIMLHFYKDAKIAGVLLAVFMIFLEIMLLTAVSIFFSTFSTPFLSGIFTISIYIIGHLTFDMKEIAKQSQNGIMPVMADFIYYFLPNLENFNVKHLVVYGIEVKNSFILLSTLYAFIYISFLLFLSIIIFQKKDLT